MRIITAIFFSGTLFSCNPFALETRIEFCDNYNHSGCQNPQKEHRIYSISVPDTKKESWFDLGYYMYFHSRQTPGIRVEFTRKLNSKEKQVLKDTLRCEYRLYKEGKEVTGHLEGLRIDDDFGGFWCFDYLGTMMVSFHKKYGSIQQKPLQSFFPVFLDLSFSSEVKEINGSRRAEIMVEW